MARRASGLWITLGIFNFVVGGLLLFCSVCGAFDTADMTVNGQNIGPQFREFVERVVPNFVVYKILLAVIGFVMGAGLIAGGVGLVIGQPWGRIISCIFGTLALIHHLAFVVLQLFYVNPAANDFFMQRFPGPFAPTPFYKTATLIAVILYVLYAIYYLTMLICLAASGVPPEQPEMQYEDDRTRRRPSWHQDDEWDDRSRHRHSRDDDLPPPRDFR